MWFPPINNIKLVLAISAACVLVFLTWHYLHTLEENKRLRKAVSDANVTIAILDKKATAEEKITADTDKLIREIKNAPKENDGRVAPVLDNLLDSLDGMRANTQ